MENEEISNFLIKVKEMMNMYRFAINNPGYIDRSRHQKELDKMMKIYEDISVKYGVKSENSNY